MPITKIGPKHQITIPKEIFEKLSLEVGDFLDAWVKDDLIILVPKKLIPKAQTWFFSEEWQKKEAEADEDIVEGRIAGPFDKIEDLLKDLKSKG